MDNDCSCSICIQLTGNSLQGDSWPVQQDMPQPTKGSWGEGTPTGDNKGQ